MEQLKMQVEKCREVLLLPLYTKVAEGPKIQVNIFDNG